MSRAKAFSLPSSNRADFTMMVQGVIHLFDAVVNWMKSSMIW